MTPSAASTTAPRRDYGAWEQAEVARSSVEASLTPADALRVGTGIRNRYLNPPANTAYPLDTRIGCSAMCAIVLSSISGVAAGATRCCWRTAARV